MAAALLNPDATIELIHHGHERQPILVIDDMLADAKAWVAERHGGTSER